MAAMAYEYACLFVQEVWPHEEGMRSHLLETRERSNSAMQLDAACSSVLGDRLRQALVTNLDLGQWIGVKIVKLC